MESARQILEPAEQAKFLGGILTALELDSERVSPRRGFALAFGILVILLGIAAFFVAPAATVGTVFVLGWLMIISGIIEDIHAFYLRRWSGVFPHLIASVLGVLIGLLIVTHPLAGALTLTLLFAAFLCIVGLFRLAETQPS